VKDRKPNPIPLIRLMRLLTASVGPFETNALCQLVISSNRWGQSAAEGSDPDGSIAVLEVDGQLGRGGSEQLHQVPP
jgi:hypothetical protein